MSDKHDAQEERPLVTEFTHGGHELDTPDAPALFKIMIGLVVILIVAGIVVSQLYQRSARKIEAELTAVPSERLVEYREEMRKIASGYRQLDAEVGRYRVPADHALELVLADPARLRPAPAPKDFVHPDDEAKQAAEDAPKP